MSYRCVIIPIPRLVQGCSREPYPTILGTISDGYCRNCTDHITRCMCDSPFYEKRAGDSMIIQHNEIRGG